MPKPKKTPSPWWRTPASKTGEKLFSLKLPKEKKQHARSKTDAERLKAEKRGKVRTFVMALRAKGITNPAEIDKMVKRKFGPRFWRRKNLLNELEP